MGLPWLKVAVDVADHPKLGVLESELTLVEGIGLAVVIRLWCWAARFYPDGTIPKAAWPGMASNALRSVTQTVEPVEFVDALTTAGLVERIDGACQLHDWDDFNSAHAKGAEQNRERQRRFRERRRALLTSSLAGTVHSDGVTLSRNARNAPRVDKIREERTTTPQPPANSAGDDSGAVSVAESQAPEPEVLNGHEVVALSRAEQPRLRKRKRPETLAQSTKFDLERIVDERSRELCKALVYRPMSEPEALAYANARWPTGPPNERVVALAFEAYAMRAGAAPGGMS